MNIDQADRLALEQALIDIREMRADLAALAAQQVVGNQPGESNDSPRKPRRDWFVTLLGVMAIAWMLLAVGAYAVEIAHRL